MTTPRDEKYDPLFKSQMYAFDNEGKLKTGFEFEEKDESYRAKNIFTKVIAWGVYTVKKLFSPQSEINKKLENIRKNEFDKINTALNGRPLKKFRASHPSTVRTQTETEKTANARNLIPASIISSQSMGAGVMTPVIAKQIADQAQLKVKEIAESSSLTTKAEAAVSFQMIYDRLQNILGKNRPLHPEIKAALFEISADTDQRFIKRVIQAFDPEGEIVSSNATLEKRSLVAEKIFVKIVELAIELSENPKYSKLARIINSLSSQLTDIINPLTQVHTDSLISCLYNSLEEISQDEDIKGPLQRWVNNQVQANKEFKRTEGYMERFSTASNIREKATWENIELNSQNVFKKGERVIYFKNLYNTKIAVKETLDFSSLTDIDKLNRDDLKVIISCLETLSSVEQPGRLEIISEYFSLDHFPIKDKSERKKLEVILLTFAENIDVKLLDALRDFHTTEA
ncbi:MAG: hypothetical protein K0S74_676 [Chlamydiales bacterium]|jgi:hypothetical protein|nr:hypothetical protein [Chlamydiales bacterium]